MNIANTDLLTVSKPSSQKNDNLFKPSVNSDNPEDNHSFSDTLRKSSEAFDKSSENTISKQNKASNDKKTENTDVKTSEETSKGVEASEKKDVDEVSDSQHTQKSEAENSDKAEKTDKNSEKQEKIENEKAEEVVDTEDGESKAEDQEKNVKNLTKIPLSSELKNYKVKERNGKITTSDILKSASEKLTENDSENDVKTLKGKIEKLEFSSEETKSDVKKSEKHTKEKSGLKNNSDTKIPLTEESRNTGIKESENIRVEVEETDIPDNINNISEKTRVSEHINHSNKENTDKKQTVKVFSKSKVNESNHEEYKVELSKDNNTKKSLSESLQTGKTDKKVNSDLAADNNVVKKIGKVEVKTENVSIPSEAVTLVGTEEFITSSPETINQHSASNGVLNSKQLNSLLSKFSSRRVKTNFSLWQKSGNNGNEFWNGNKVAKFTAKDTSMLTVKHFIMKYSVEKKTTKGVSVDKSLALKNNIQAKNDVSKNVDTVKTSLKELENFSVKKSYQQLQVSSRTINIKNIDEIVKTSASLSTDKTVKNMYKPIEKANFDTKIQEKPAEKIDVQTNKNQKNTQNSDDTGDNDSQRNIGETTVKTQKVSITPEQLKSNIENITKNISTLYTKITQNNSRIETAQIQLTPPNLGKVVLEIVKDEGKISVLIRVENSDAKEMLQKNSHLLANRLNSMGVETQKIQIQTEATEDNYQQNERNNSDSTSENGKDEKQNHDTNSETEEEKNEKSFADILKGGN